jgi:polysaccharide biosynthesis/export protein
MVNDFMHKSQSRLILFSLCFQGVMLAPALAQNTGAPNIMPSTPSTTTAPGMSVAPAPGGSAGGAIMPTSAYQAPTQTPVNNAVSAPTSGTTGSTRQPSMGGAAATPAGESPSNYILGPEDTITVRVFAADDIPDRPAEISNDGNVTLPMVGQIHAAGLTVDQLQASLTSAYKKFFKDPQVTVQVTDFRSQPVSVAGNVATPGVVQLRGNRNLMEVISQAGGLRADAGDSVLITRDLREGPIPVAGAFTDPTGKYSVAHVNIRKIMAGSDPETNVMIKAHDVITVPRARLIYVLGNVNRPGGYVMTDNESVSLTQAIALAGGWNSSAMLSGTRILRASGGAEREQIPANIKKIMDNKSKDLQLQPDDILYVPNSFMKQFSQRGVEAAIGLGTGIAVYR